MFSDLRYALRLLGKNLSFTVIAVLTLGVGIGAATVVFSAVNALFLKPLPLVQDVERLLYFSQADHRRGERDIGINHADFRDIEERSTTLEGAWAHSDRTVIIAGGTEPERLVGTEITANAFDLMGVPPLLGRSFGKQDEDPATPATALISHRLWQRRFGGAPDILGSTLRINEQPTAVIGVMPPGWAYPEYTDVWTPLRLEGAKATTRGAYWLSGRAKMKAGVTLAEVQAEVDAIMAALSVEHPTTNEGIGMEFVPLREEATEEAAQSTKLLFGAVLFVFLIACLNVANLLLSRASSRSKEIAVRLALGAERSRIVRQLLTESVLLGLLGGVAALIFSLWGLDLMVAVIPIDIPFWLRFDFDWRVFAFVLALSLLASTLFGLGPAFRAARPSVVSELKEGGRNSNDTGAQAHGLRNILVVVEVAIALILLVGAGLLLRSFLNLRDLNPGYQRENVLTFRTGFPQGMMPEKDVRLRQFFDQVEDRLEKIAGVVSVGMTNNHLYDGGLYAAGVIVEGTEEPKSTADVPLASSNKASRGYFETLQIPLLLGRSFETTDNDSSPPVAVVDVAFARQHFGGPAEALGKRFRILSPPGEELRWIEVVGVVGNVVAHPEKSQQVPAFYVPVSQELSNFMTVVIRTQSEPMAYIETARAEVMAVNRSIPIYHVMTLEDVFIRSVWTRKFFGYLFTASGGIALFLACIGIYGVMTYNVDQRRLELGMRLALGAQPHEVIRMVLQHGLRLVGTGLLFGLIGAYFSVQLLAGSLYGVSPHDPPTFALVPLLLVAVALLACYLPSRRISRIDPNAALRCE